MSRNEPGRCGGVSLERQRGVALISVLLVVAVVVAVGAALLRERDQQRRRTAALLHGGQALRYLTALEDWAAVVLERDRNDGTTDTLSENWALKLVPMAVDGGLLGGELEDAQGRFNLNNLVVEGEFNASEQARFVRLMEALDISSARSEDIADALRDWIDEDQTESGPGGGEDYYYLGLPLPYRTAARPLAAASELRLLRGVDAEIWRALAPYVVALPGYRPVNVNTAPEPVLRSLSAHIDEARAQDILDERLSGAFDNGRAFLDFIGETTEADAIAADSIAVGSDYFLLKAQVAVGEAQLRGTALIRRDEQSAVVLRRALGEAL